MSLTAADVNTPFYYLTNFHTALNWVLSHSADLLNTCEQEAVGRFQQLPQPAQALLLRMVMRKGDWFRHSALQYEEIPARTDALTALENAGFCVANAAVSSADLGPLLRKDELLAVLERERQKQPDLIDDKSLKKLRKDELQQTFEQALHEVQPQPLSAWLQQDDALVQLTCMPLFDTVRVLFFGNVWQDWSEFVLTELGHQRYENVPLSVQSRAFRDRDELTYLLFLSDCQQQLHDAVQQLKDKRLSAEAVSAVLHGITRQLLQHSPVLQSMPHRLADTHWLTLRWHKVLAQVGREAERLHDTELALTCYDASAHRDAMVRRLRVLELAAVSVDDFRAVASGCTEALARIEHPEARITLERIYARCARKAGLAKPAPTQKAIKDFPSLYLTLSDNGDAVEYQVRDALNANQNGRCYYVENTLLSGLFALLFWDALYAPLPGAFFHPFQSGPADLFRDDFVRARQPLFDAGFARLQGGEHVALIRQRWHEKQGISCPLLHWPSLDEELLEHALRVIAPATLSQLFRHLLSDLRHHSRGLPDLIWLGNNEADGFRLIEVKGPGDRLQDHQRLWLEVFLRSGIEAQVAYVSYAQP
ncbi:VRR-NUC domain-containing protein [Thalassolituus sp. LLYu03]|uniref:VRR-NUC domain-containing protein n=1 Tax=Thalassolituus sp. LLYu03 TaxID=3421656 RepID=UPI003D276198